MNTNINDFKSKGLIAVPYPEDLREAVEKTVESWKKFCELPLEVKKGLPYSNNADGVGYELKNGIGHKADRKENFDMTAAGAEWLRRNADGINNPIALEFLQNVTALVGIMKPTILGFARSSEEAFGLEGFYDEVEEGDTDAFFVRFIHYFGDREVEDEIASAHVDQSGFTLHLFESDPGLKRLTYAGEWTDMPVSEDETVIIPGMQMQLRSKGELRALCHRVVATQKTAHTGRYSAVCFVQLKNTAKYDKDTYGRLQEEIPGFNYSIPYEELSKRFKK